MFSFFIDTDVLELYFSSIFKMTVTKTKKNNSNSEILSELLGEP